MIAGHDFTDIELFETVMMGHHMENSMWYRLSKRVHTCSKLLFKESSDEVIEMIKKSGEWILLSDAGWSNRGWSAAIAPCH